MPTLQRRTLRLNLASRRLRDSLSGVTTYSPAASATLVVMANTLAVPDFSGEDHHQRAYLRVGTGNLATFSDYRVGSFNTGSGAFVGLAVPVQAIQSGAVFEVHDKLSAAEMDSAIDETIAQLRVRQEVALNSIDGARFYDLDGVASPHFIVNYLDAWYYANPGSSLNRDRRELVQHEFVVTGSGAELRISGGLTASVQIVIDALLQATLAADDSATVSLPDEETILWGAAARCYDTLIQDSPSQEAALYEKRRREAARTFSMLAQRFFPDVSKPMTFAPIPNDPLE